MIESAGSGVPDCDDAERVGDVVTAWHLATV